MILSCAKPNCKSNAIARSNYCEFHANQKRLNIPMETDLWTTNWIYLFPVAIIVLVLLFAFISGELGKCWG